MRKSGSKPKSPGVIGTATPPGPRPGPEVKPLREVVYASTPAAGSWFPGDQRWSQHGALGLEALRFSSGTEQLVLTVHNGFNQPHGRLMLAPAVAARLISELAAGLAALAGKPPTP
jgi:hypothetical protein